jgi:hypothetical protein
VLYLYIPSLGLPGLWAVVPAGKTIEPVSLNVDTPVTVPDPLTDIGITIR